MWTTIRPSMRTRGPWPCRRAEFFTRWMTHLCAPTFVFLAGTALALSVERRIAKGADAWEIDKKILIRGAIIALARSSTVISLGLGRLSLERAVRHRHVDDVHDAAAAAADLGALACLGVGWFLVGEVVTGMVWLAAGLRVRCWRRSLRRHLGRRVAFIKYPVIPWLAMMVLGWVFGRHMAASRGGQARGSRRDRCCWSPAWRRSPSSRSCGARRLRQHVPAPGRRLLAAVAARQQVPAVADLRGAGLGPDMAVSRRDDETRAGHRRAGERVAPVLGQTAMFYYLVHRFVFEIPATYFGLRGVGDLSTTYMASAVLLVLLYPACRWYRTVKAAHPASLLKYF